MTSKTYQDVYVYIYIYIYTFIPIRVNCQTSNKGRPLQHRRLDISMITSSNGNIVRVTGPLCDEFTGHRWIPRKKSQWRGALMFSLICTWINGWVNNGEAGDLRSHRAHYDVTVMGRHIGDRDTLNTNLDGDYETSWDLNTNLNRACAKLGSKTEASIKVRNK